MEHIEHSLILFLCFLAIFQTYRMERGMRDVIRELRLFTDAVSAAVERMKR